MGRKQPAPYNFFLSTLRTRLSAKVCSAVFRLHCAKSKGNFPTVTAYTKLRKFFFWTLLSNRTRTLPRLFLSQILCTLLLYCSIDFSNCSAISCKENPYCFAKFLLLSALSIHCLHLQRYTPLPLSLPVPSTTAPFSVHTIRINCVLAFICRQDTHILSGIFFAALNLTLHRHCRRQTFHLPKRTNRT